MFLVNVGICVYKSFSNGSREGNYATYEVLDRLCACDHHKEEGHDLEQVADRQFSRQSFRSLFSVNIRKSSSR